MKLKGKRNVLVFLVVLLIFALGGAVGYFGKDKFNIPITENKKQKDKYIAFSNEIFEKIQSDYWDKLEEKDLVDKYVKISEKLTGQIITDIPETKDKFFNSTLKDILGKYGSDDQKKEFVLALSDNVLASLDPPGRSRLFSKKMLEDLAQNVNNITEENLYSDLEIDKNATQETIDDAYQEKSNELKEKAKTDSEAEKQLEQVQKAHEVLADKDAKELYDLHGIEPTMEYKPVSPHVFYIKLTKFSPTTVDELKRVTDKVEDDSVDSLIFDLRDNVGGSIDSLPFFLGAFIGQDQYAYQFFKQGDKTDFKTKTGWLPGMVKFKKVVFLINENTQSSAEVTAAVVKKYNVGVLVGKTTKGWGTVEKVFPIKNQLSDNEEYSIYLVHSLTLRDDNQPIEGRGVDPHVDIDDANWKQELLSYYDSNELVNAVESVY